MYHVTLTAVTLTLAKRKTSEKQSGNIRRGESQRPPCVKPFLFAALVNFIKTKAAETD